MKEWFKPGDIVKTKGKYCLSDKNGSEYLGMQILLNQGDVFPPADKDGQLYFIDGID